jgi:glycosyltransferase involved in cell wall biosynthesis
VNLRRVLFLSSYMKRGYGVSVVAHEIAQRSRAYGWDVIVGCLEVDETFSGEGVVHAASDPASLLELCRSLQVEAVVAQTSPYFEALPGLTHELPTVVFEHGDPAPHFFGFDAHERQRIRRNKIDNVYPHVTRVLASSHFLRHDIEWTSAAIVPLGCDHVPDLGVKDLALAAHRRASPLRVGTLMRLGEGESRYKGVDLYADLVGALEGSGVSFAVMGRGTDEDRERWEALGVEVHLNASDAERAEYLRDLDVLVSPSMWEGFNLPLVEAQASGTVAIGFDLGAHPETTPYVMSSVGDAVALVEAWRSDRDLLARASRGAHRFVRSKFSWDSTARLLAGHLDEVTKAHAAVHVPQRRASYAQRLERLVRREGVVGAGRVVVRRIGSRLAATRT